MSKVQNKWKDKRRGENRDTVVGSELLLGRFKVTVHRYIGYPDNVWFISITGLMVHMYQAESKQLPEVKLFALQLVKNILDTTTLHLQSTEGSDKL